MVFLFIIMSALAIESVTAGFVFVNGQWIVESDLDDHDIPLRAGTTTGGTVNANQYYTYINYNSITDNGVYRLFNFDGQLRFGGVIPPGQLNSFLNFINRYELVTLFDNTLDQQTYCSADAPTWSTSTTITPSITRKSVTTSLSGRPLSDAAGHAFEIREAQSGTIVLTFGVAAIVILVVLAVWKRK